ncbi:lytic transglycosylase domain-containing protein [Aureimonas populi]|uniref:Lytic transglycosylase domain-containing protein n=1 Tax=Aureimonas populi TaxID=1701758 RepID=A0ABW5CFK7_9HYPH|nr:lytic transglycosylase domain-containing protein [Aureimonas populi]
MTAKSAAITLGLQTALAGLLLASCTAESMLPSVGPMPTMRSGVSAASSTSGVDSARFGAPVPTPANPALARGGGAAAPASATAFTASIASMGARSAVSPVRGSLKDGLDATHQNMARARAIREGMAPGSLDRQILTWAIALRGGSDVPAAEVARAAHELSSWPGMATLRANSERALHREKPPAATVINAFAGGRPQTPEGAMVLARAYQETGDTQRARGLIAETWRNDRLTRELETEMLRSFGSLLTKNDHKFRMEKLLYANRITEAERVSSLANSETLFRARVASIRGENAAARLSAVPANQHSDPSYQFARAVNLRKADRPQEAAAVLLSVTRDPAALIDPDAWWNERRIVARMLVERKGDARTAYRLAAEHSSSGLVSTVEAEFHAGWYALRLLNDPVRASRHFAKIAEVSNRPLSQSRAYYWMGRAAEAGGPGSARDFYGRAARHGATYYGQLANAKLGRTPGEIAFPRPSDAERRRFSGREAVRAITRLQEIGSDWRAASLYRALAEEVDSPGELALLSTMAERRGNHALALDVGKIAYARGVDAPALAFPVGVIPASANINASGRALAYAIARQESAFNPQAKSPAGALGLLQLMPGTARSLSREIGASYSEAKLLNDVSYNAQLGSRYLGQQIDTFAGSYVLTFAAYNAGPRRAREWVERFGDPRGRPIDEVVDWVEQIPFTETRNYVQRVMENYQVYKMRLGAGFNIEGDLRHGRRS